ncbi:MAG TPA: (Fe-S)-binding protein [Rhodanobacteraceae bacterium]|nr:(Fe-S)-binding protein [Rhodanobacteraceae bacterium]
MPADPQPAAAGRRSKAESATGGAGSGDTAALADGLLALADQCVMCGLCLPHCPTYRISLDEAESPRGRIALARSLASGRLPPAGPAWRHLDQCLACRSCEIVCPSGVRYGEIIERSRAAEARIRPRRGLDRWLGDPDGLVALARVGAWLRADRWLPALGRLLPRTSPLGALARAVPRAPALPQRAPARPAGRQRGTVALFRGCVASVYDRDTHAAARFLLEALGYDVRVPEGSPCCGTLARHAGDTDAATRQNALVRDALAATGAATVLVSATGCFGELRDRASSDQSIVDIDAFLARDAGLARLRFRPLAARVALHLPCTQVNVVGEVASIRALLARIPNLDVIDLPLQPRCCGAAGNYFAEHPAIATRLRDEKLDQALEAGPDLVLTTNIGCRIHLAAGLRERGVSPRVMHPLALLAQQLENGGP